MSSKQQNKSNGKKAGRVDPMANTPDGKKPVWSFQTRSRCPRCGSLQTVHRSTQGRYQYRKCARVICRRNYRIVGEPA